MTFHPTLRLLAASIALALAGATHAQAPAAPTTNAPTTSTAPAPTTAPAPAAAPQPGTATSAPKDRPSQRATPSQQPKGGAPRGTPGVAAVPGAAPAGAQAAKAERNRERRPENTGNTRQLQNAYADLMTPEEMAAHRAKVKKTKTYAECKALFEATDKEMEARAKAQNKTVKATPAEICDRAKERGRLTG